MHDQGLGEGGGVGWVSVAEGALWGSDRRCFLLWGIHPAVWLMSSTESGLPRRPSLERGWGLL